MAKHNKVGAELELYRAKKSSHKVATGHYARRFNKRHKVVEFCEAFANARTKVDTVAGRLTVNDQEADKLRLFVASNEGQYNVYMSDKRLASLNLK